MRKYELTYLISDEVQESDLNKVTGKVTNFVVDLGGKVQKEDIWGRRKLAYPIRKQGFATYITLYFELPADKVREFEQDMHHTDGIVRQLLIVKESGKEAISLTSEEIAGSKDIEGVIGGDKSFEAVEGETEDSKKLMSVREAKEEETEEPAQEEVAAEIPAEESVEEIEEPKEEIAKPVKSRKPKAESKEEPAETESKAESVKPKAEKKPAKKKEVTDEVERLSKLNEELDDILKDEL